MFESTLEFYYYLVAGFRQTLENLENLENLEKQSIWKKSGKLRETEGIFFKTQIETYCHNYDILLYVCFIIHNLSELKPLVCDVFFRETETFKLTFKVIATILWVYTHPF